MKYKKIAIIALGKRNAGKSSTWYEFFGKVIRSGLKHFSINGEKVHPMVRNSSFEETGEEVEDYFSVYLINPSPEESGNDPEDYLDEDNLPLIVFCSVQYVEHGIKTITWFKDHGYYLYIQWLNPGYKDTAEYPDHLGFEDKFRSDGTFIKISGEEKINRVAQIKKFLSKWVRR